MPKVGATKTRSNLKTKPAKKSVKQTVKAKTAPKTTATPKTKTPPKTTSKKATETPARAPASSIDALFATVAANPDDGAAYLVLADALEQHGDPRAELMQIQQRLAAENLAPKERKRLVAREQEIIAERREKILGKLAKDASITLEYRF